MTGRQTMINQTAAQVFMDYLNLIIPGKLEGLVMLTAGTVWSGLTLAFGTIDLSLKWLFAFVVIDYLTGTLAACKTGELCSRVGFQGIFKKVFIFVIVALCHGIDVTAGTDFLRNAVIMAYSINEVASTLENIDRMGFGGVIPPFLQNALKQIKEQKQLNIKAKGIAKDE